MTLQRPLVWHGYGTACEVMASSSRSQAATHFTFWWKGQAVVLGSLASGLANAVFLAPQLKGDTTRESCYGHRYRPEDTDDEKNLSLIPGDDATRARRDHRGWHTGDKDADRNTG